MKHLSKRGIHYFLCQNFQEEINNLIGLRSIYSLDSMLFSQLFLLQMQVLVYVPMPPVTKASTLGTCGIAV